jgi:glycosyltransferase involved in cell wall biosynthesis
MTQSARRRLRIALVVHDYHRSGGHSRYVVELAERFARDHEVHLFATRVDAEVPPGVTVHHVPAVRRSTLATILTFVLPASVLVRGDYDIVHGQGFSCFPADVVTAHICNRAWHLAQRRTGLGVTAKERIFDGIVSPLERLTYQAGSWVIACSRRVADDLGEYYGRRDRVSVVYHGVDLETFSPEVAGRLRATVRARLGLGEDETVFLFVGDMRKGAAVNIEAPKLRPRKSALKSPGRVRRSPS